VPVPVSAGNFGEVASASCQWSVVSKCAVVKSLDVAVSKAECSLSADRIVPDVFLKMREMFRAADDVIEAFVTPDVSGPRKNAFKPMRRERFPGMKNVAQLISACRQCGSFP
jgi:hypothetical protein